MILLFTNINKYRLALISLAVAAMLFSYKLYAEQKNIFYLPNKEGQIFWKCSDGLCTTYLQIKTEKPVSLLEKGPSPKIDELDGKLVRLFYSCGSPCNYTIFYDAKNGVSRAFEFTVAINPMEKIVVIAEKKSLVAYKIFDKTQRPLFSVKKDWSPVATLFSDIIEAKFIKDGLYIKYLQGPNFIEKDEIIPNG